MPQKNTKKKNNTGIVLGTTGIGLGAATELRRRSYHIGDGDPNKITIIHSPAEKGSGHKAVADALKSRLEARGVEVQILDTKNSVPSYIKHKFYTANSAGYAEEVQKNPAKVFGSTFLRNKKKSTIADKTKSFLTDLYYEGRSNILGESSGLKKDIKKFKPGRVVTTYFGSVPGLADMDKRIDTVVTDYVPSPNLWKRKNAGTYFVPTDEAKNLFKKHGIPDKHLSVIGDIPADFEKSVSKTINRVPKNITVMGGGLGLRTEEVAPIVSKYLKEKGYKNSTVTVLPGKGDTIARDYLSKTKLPDNLKVVGLGEKDFKKYIKDSDLVITRPGGATTSELRAYGKPSITFSEFKESAPYHESGNARTLSKGRHNVHVILNSEKYSKDNIKPVYNALDKVFAKYPEMHGNALKSRKSFIANQDKIVDELLKAEVFKNTKTSKITKAGRIGAAALVGAGAYNYLKKTAEDNKATSSIVYGLGTAGLALGSLALKNKIVGNSAQNAGILLPFLKPGKYVRGIKDYKNLKKIDKLHGETLSQLENLGNSIKNKSALKTIKDLKKSKKKLVELSEMNEKLKAKHGVKDLSDFGEQLVGGNSAILAGSGGLLGGVLYGKLKKRTEVS